MIVDLDTETRSRVDLKRYGVYRYVTCPDFAVLMAGFSVDGGPVYSVDTAAEYAAEFTRLWDAGAQFRAHNAAFDRVVTSAALGLGVGDYLDPERWDCTMMWAAERGLPKNLAALAKVLGVSEKDEAGKDLIRLFCKPVSAGKRKGEWNGAATHPMQWMDFLAYLNDDVAALGGVAGKLGGHVTAAERRAYVADQIINDRGLVIDLALAGPAKTNADANQHAQKARVTEISGIENPGSPSQIRDWLTLREVKIPNLKAKTVERLLTTDLEPDVREVLELRQELALAAPAKFASALGMHTDGRLRGTIAFFGAHTGRWAGRGTQPHNLPRAHFTNEVDQHLAIEELFAGDHLSSEELKMLVRAMFLGPLTVADYASIEARMISWLAGEEWALQAFRDGRDIYTETALRMSPGTTRQQGKAAVLGLGYAGGPQALRVMMNDGDPLLALSDEQLREDIVLPWRAANPAIVRFWARLQDAFGRPGPVGRHIRTTESRNSLGRTVHIHLPSGRAISYHGVKWETYYVTDTVVNAKTGEVSERRVKKQGYRFANPAAPFSTNARIGTFGGKLAENVVQAASRDVLAEALVRLLARGYDVVGHVHDEALVSGHHFVEEIAAVMCEPPAWAGGLPLAAEGFTCSRYRKG